MDPQYLHAIMHGELSRAKRKLSRKRTRIDNELDKEIDACLCRWVRV